MFLNITPAVANWSADNKSFSLIFDENPLADFVELPNDGRAQDELWFSNMFCGILRGALEMVSSRVERITQFSRFDSSPFFYLFELRHVVFVEVLPRTWSLVLFHNRPDKHTTIHYGVNTSLTYSKGPNASGSPLCQRCASGQRYYGDESHPTEVHGGRNASR